MNSVHGAARSTAALRGTGARPIHLTLLAACALLLFAVPMRAGFDEVVDALSHTPGLHRISIPFFGLARFLVRVSHPQGVHDMQLATFEGSGSIAEEDLATILRDSARDGYRQVVRSRSRRTGEVTLIFARPDGDIIDMLIVTHDRVDTTVVRAVVDSDVFAHEVNGDHSATRVAAR